MHSGTSKLGRAKNFLAAHLSQNVLAYVSKKPETNFPRLLNLVKLLAIQERHKRQVETVAAAYRENAAIREYVNRLARNLHPNVRNRLAYNWFMNAMIFGIPRQRSMSAKLGVNVPNFILVDPTTACNLACEGCWAGKYSPKNSLSPERLDRLFSEAKELGIYWIVFSGGEPLVYPHLFDLMAKHHDMAFMAYTNGTLINEKMADRIIEVGNFSPAISLEGWRERTDARRGPGTFDKVIRAMDLLRERGAAFGVSITITRENVMEVTSDEFIDFLIDKGVIYGWTFHYIPIGRNPNVNLMITPEQRAYLAERIPYIRTHKPIQIADFWNDGELVEGCIAGGRRYFHINAAGEVEPCAFVHFAVDNINEKSLLEVLHSPLFAAYQKRQPFHDNLLRPCPIIDVPQALRDIVKESGAHPTHEGADSVLEGIIAAHLDERSREWGRVADQLWAERQLFKKVQGF
ncbi:radical SAM protein [Desulfofundulus thermosubterraneus]|uniref:Radical SAM superfamily enzyme, MoaA/NifB/PqqE/SkfB family n=1 Tax=Desulfofundulus thermosubterraneus DSM 16057 TaxID=1121432 RepID=A0A1M6C5Y8_9FIRM|nr:radical SAM protein [Desulfofundulus thermosubterraneus]SHI56148.1 Radical SAM superfamily enzyme, MoaA/NifB/PqqE/SkfB family [Desulfofundulus thermosubterraneus DSM 16057]